MSKNSEIVLVILVILLGVGQVYQLMQVAEMSGKIESAATREVVSPESAEIPQGEEEEVRSEDNATNVAFSIFLLEDSDDLAITKDQALAILSAMETIARKREQLMALEKELFNLEIGLTKILNEKQKKFLAENQYLLEEKKKEIDSLRDKEDPIKRMMIELLEGKKK